MAEKNNEYGKLVFGINIDDIRLYIWIRYDVLGIGMDDVWVGD